MTTGGDKLLLGLVRIHVLAAAEAETIWGNKILAELRQLDQTLSPGTLYPLIHGLVRDGLLEAVSEGSNRRRQCFRLTDEGRQTLDHARIRMVQLLDSTGTAKPADTVETTAAPPRAPEPSRAIPEEQPVHLL